MKTNQTNSFWTASNQDVFGGYGIFATGKTKQEAGQALWKLYKHVSPLHNDNGEQTFKQLDAFEDWWGIHYRRCIVGEAYFGDNDADTKSKAYKEIRTRTQP